MTSMSIPATVHNDRSTHSSPMIYDLQRGSELRCKTLIECRIFVLEGGCYVLGKKYGGAGGDRQITLPSNFYVAIYTFRGCKLKLMEDQVDEVFSTCCNWNLDILKIHYELCSRRKEARGDIKLAGSSGASSRQ